MDQERPVYNLQPSFIPAGWIGGFSTTPPEEPFPEPYPKPVLLAKLDFAGNMDNIPNILRMLRAKWPEFSWEETPGDPATRLYQMFAPDISRLGYDDKGQVWSIICPQQGIYFPALGATMNIEVTVTGNKGWIDELAPTEELFAADITVQPTIWFSPDSVDSIFWQHLLTLNGMWSGLLPLSKSTGLKLYTLNEESTNDTVPVRMGVYPNYPFPERASHWGDYARTVANLAIRIGGIKPSGNAKVDEFNAWVMDLFNLGSGKLLQKDTLLIWNLWAGSPELVNQAEWQHHADYWRHSIDVNHRPPEGEGTSITDINGNPLVIDELCLGAKIAEFLGWIALQFLERAL